MCDVMQAAIPHLSHIAFDSQGMVDKPASSRLHFCLQAKPDRVVDAPADGGGQPW